MRCPAPAGLSKRAGSLALAEGRSGQALFRRASRVTGQQTHKQQAVRAPPAPLSAQNVPAAFLGCGKDDRSGPSFLSSKHSFSIVFQHFPDIWKDSLRTCIHNQGMPDGRGILLSCKAKKRRQYFVYCKVFQRGRPAKDPLRRWRMVVNTGS